jgi:CheY-like chemotaxis protein
MKKGKQMRGELWTSEINQALSTPLRILLAEDLPEMRDALVGLLRTEGQEIVAVSCGADALREVANNGPFDVIISDYNMPPGMTGGELNRKLNHSGFHVPFILFSGNIQGISEQEFNSLELYAFLEKPNGLTILVSYLQDIQLEKFEKVGPYFRIQND